MLILVSYDVSVTSSGGKRRLRQVAKTCINFGQRVQCSVFECIVDPSQWIILKSKLESIIDTEFDSLRYYYLGSNWIHKVEHVGAKPSRNLDDPIIV
jgi:CRISPR-associated protein Cas2